MSNKLKYIYLVQGEKRLIKTHFHLNDRVNAKALFLTYDEPLDGAVFFPNSTWAEGRNELLKRAKRQFEHWEYLIFVDDDTEFYLGGWSDFEKALDLFRPKIGVPVFDRTITTVLPYPLFQVQSFTFNDEQLMAFRYDVIEDAVVLPYQTKFDSIHWWATCRLQQILTQNTYPEDILQFNFVRVSNLEHERYTVASHDDKSYKVDVLQWVQSHYEPSYKDVNKKPSYFLLLKKTFKVFCKLKLFKLAFKLSNLRESWRFFLNRRTLTDAEIISLVKKGGAFYLYGYGEIGKSLHSKMKLSELNPSIKGISDRKALNGAYYDGEVLVIAPSDLKISSNDKVLVASNRFIDEIESFLIYQLKLSREQLIFIDVSNA